MRFAGPVETGPVGRTVLTKITRSIVRVTPSSAGVFLLQHYVAKYPTACGNRELRPPTFGLFGEPE